MGRPARPGREARRSDPSDGERIIPTIRCAVEYDGTAFCGFQFQPTVRTVAAELEAVLSRMLSEPVKLSGAGRTDTGVHASGQVVSFTTARAFPFDRLAIALNSSLPPDISVRDVAVLPYDFSARFSARERTYVYAIWNRRDRSALLAHRAYHVHAPLDLDAMRAGAAHLLGEHDFRSFCGVPPDNGITVRTVKRLEIETRDGFLRICISADGFVHRMVRTVVGTLVECGIGRRNPDSIPEILAARARESAGLTAPAHGLYLAGVKYEDGYDSFQEPPLWR